MANTNRKSASGTKLRITKRIVNTKRHIVGYVIGGESLSVNQARGLAATNRIAGVRVVGNHIQAVPGRKRLASLPTQVNRG